MDRETERELRRDPVAWLEAEIGAIMGAEGAGYSAEPVSVYMVVAQEIAKMRRQRAAVVELLSGGGHATSD